MSGGGAVLPVALAGFPAALAVAAGTAASAEAQQKDIDAMSSSFAKLYKAAKGCESVTFFSDQATLTTGSASVWTSRADFDAFAKSPDYVALRAKLKPLTKGTPDEKIYKVTEPK